MSTPPLVVGAAEAPPVSPSASSSVTSSSSSSSGGVERAGAGGVRHITAAPSPAPSSTTRPPEPQRRRPSAAAPAGPTALIDWVGQAAAPAAHGGTPSRVPSAHTPRWQQQQQQQQRRMQDEEELTQLARSLRSEIIGEPFLLTAAFSPVSRGPSSGGSGDRRKSAGSQLGTERAPATTTTTVDAAATAEQPMLPVVTVSLVPATAAHDVPLPPSSPRVPSQRREAAPLAVQAARVTRAGPTANPATAASTAAVCPLPSTPCCEEGCADTAALHSVAELRHRLLTEDFFSSPFRKFRRDGKFPWKLFTSVVLCVLLVLQVMWYQLPLARANESMRRAITEHFMGDDFDSKGHGDIVAAPTAWMEGLYASIEHYVAVYYNLSNTSSSDMNYYCVSPPVIGDEEAAAGAWANRSRAVPPFLWRPGKNTSAGLRGEAEGIPLSKTPAITTSAIAPVLMRVQVDAYSRREGAQHADTRADLRHGGWWAWASAADTTTGDEMRWLTFYVDAAHPLGPLAKYRDAARRLRRAGKERRRRAHALRKATKAAAKIAKKGGGGGNGAGSIGTSDQAGEVDAALSMVCQPRLDELSGLHYRPCASLPPATVSAGPSAAAMAADLLPPPSSFFPEFSLMDNVRAIHLEVTLRHETGDGGNTLRGAPAAAAAADDGAVAALLRQHRPRGVTGGAVEEEAAVFQWKVAKTIEVHPGGLVETQLQVQTRIWPKGTSLRQRWGPSHTMAALLGVLALLELALRVRALWRIQQYQRRLHRERLAFHAGQMRAQAAAQRRGTDGSPTTVAAAIPYEWGFPGTPAVRHLSSGATPPVVRLPPAAATTHATYGTVSEVAGLHRAAPAVTASPLLFSESSPLLVRDTSISILAAQHPAVAAASRATGAAHLISDAEEEEKEGGAAVCFSGPPSLPHTPASAAAGQRVLSTWLGRQVRRVFPRRGAAPAASRLPPPPPSLKAEASSEFLDAATPASRYGGAARPPATTTSPTTAAALRGSFRTPLLHGVSPLTPQLTERIMERSYVDLHTTWRHHLQQSMGAGWHWVGIVAATLTLSYSALLLLPLLPYVEVAQDGRYDAWSSVLLGTAALMSCLLLLSYLRFFPTLYFPILASTYVLPKLFLFALCVSPLFFGFVVFFKVAFGPYSAGRFDSLGWAGMGLYLMTYGDSLLDTVAVLSDTPYAVTAFFANVMVITFALLFMTIMLNIAMTITQHEWLRLRRRFGAALSSSSLLFAVRSRTEVKAEAVEAVRANLEVLWFMLAEEEEEEAAAAAAAATAEETTQDGVLLDPDLRVAHRRMHPVSTAAATGTGGRAGRESVGEVVAAASFTSTSPDASSSSAAAACPSDGQGQKKPSRRTKTGDARGAIGARRAAAPASPTPLHDGEEAGRDMTAGEEEEEEEEREASSAGNGASRGMYTAGSSYDVSAATTVPPE